MMFFRAVLCLVGLLLYLVVKEFASHPTGVAVQNVLQPVPLPNTESAAPVALFPAHP